MAELGNKVKNALDEARILLLGAQVLLGFQYRAFMEPGFDKLPADRQALQMAGLLLLILTLALLLLPASFHRIVERGNDSTRLVGFTSMSVTCALLPFTSAASLDLFGAADRLWGRTPGIAAGTAMALVALVFWYVLPLSHRRSPAMEEETVSRPKLSERISHVLTEARVVLPGAQALLGFQLAMMLMESFDKLPQRVRSLHFVSLCFVAVATVMLMAPAAFHRIAERGEDSERLEKFSSAMVLSALGALAFGLSSELAVVTARWTGSLQAGLELGGVCVVVLLGFWFGLTLALRP
jgi:uncharacterized protein DUF6328